MIEISIKGGGDHDHSIMNLLYFCMGYKWDKNELNFFPNFVKGNKIKKNIFHHRGEGGGNQMMEISIMFLLFYFWTLPLTFNYKRPMIQNKR